MVSHNYKRNNVIFKLFTINIIILIIGITTVVATESNSVEVSWSY